MISCEALCFQIVKPGKEHRSQPVGAKLARPLGRVPRKMDGIPSDDVLMEQQMDDTPGGDLSSDVTDDVAPQVARLQHDKEELLREKAIMDLIITDLQEKCAIQGEELQTLRASVAELPTLKNQIALLLSERKLVKKTPKVDSRGTVEYRGPSPWTSTTPKKSRLTTTAMVHKEESPPSAAKTDKLLIATPAKKEESPPSTAASHPPMEVKMPGRKSYLSVSKKTSFPPLPQKTTTMKMDSLAATIESVVAGQDCPAPEMMETETPLVSMKRARTISSSSNDSDLSEVESPRLPHVEDESPGRIPPITLRDKEAFQQVRTFCLEKNIMLTCKDLRIGISLQVSTIPAFRALTRFLTDNEIENHTYRLKEEKTLKVVIRGIPMQFSPTEVAEELQYWGYEVDKVSRLKSRKSDKKVLPILILELPRSEKKIYEEKELFNLKIQVEPLRKSAAPGQCFRCQEYGHAQSHCTAKLVCVRCGGPHRPRTCTRPREEPATCGLCGGPHPANYAGCPRRPQQKPKLTTKVSSRKTTVGLSYAAATGTQQRAQQDRTITGSRGPRDTPPERMRTSRQDAAHTSDVGSPLQALLAVLSRVDLRVLQKDLEDFLRSKPSNKK